MGSSDESLAALILRKRKFLGWTQSDLAESSGVPLRSVQKIEGGEVEPRFDNLKALAAALGITSEELWGKPKPSRSLSGKAISGPVSSHDIATIILRLADVSPERRAWTLAVLFEDESLLPDEAPEFLADAVSQSS